MEIKNRYTGEIIWKNDEVSSFVGYNFGKADLSSSNLCKANLYKANLYKANLYNVGGLENH